MDYSVGVAFNSRRRDHPELESKATPERAPLACNSANCILQSSNSSSCSRLPLSSCTTYMGSQISTQLQASTSLAPRRHRLGTRPAFFWEQKQLRFSGWLPCAPCTRMLRPAHAHARQHSLTPARAPKQPTVSALQVPCMAHIFKWAR